MNTLVSFDIAKLLKRKGYDRKVLNYFNESGEPMSRLFPLNHNSKSDIGMTTYSRPSLAEVITWLYEEHGIWLYVYLVETPLDKSVWSWNTQNPTNKLNIPFNSPIEAYMKGIVKTLPIILDKK